MRLARHLLAGLVILGLWAQSAFAAESGDQAEILRIEHAIADARTVDVILQYLDPDVVFYDFMPPTIRGRDAFKRHVEAVFATMPSFDVRIIEMDIETDGDLAFANSLQRVIVKNQAGEITLNAIFRNTNCYHRVAGRWLIKYEHISFPVDLDAGTIILDNGASSRLR
jgi:ketosteroid isomerase-like protein